MKYTSGSTGRIFVVRFEENDSIYHEVEKLCEHENIQAGIIWIIGGVKNCGVVVGPRKDQEIPLHPIVKHLADSHEIVGIGTLFKNQEGFTKLHFHAGLGRGDSFTVGCPREGLDSWLVTEAILLELTNVNAKRVKDTNGFELLTVFS